MNIFPRFIGSTLNLPRLCVAALALASFTVSAETTNCTAITTLPYVISTQGVYCFTRNIGTSMTSGNAITITTNNVTIDMNGFKLGGLAAGTGTYTTGIAASQLKNITIRNGTIRGFHRGISIGFSLSDEVGPVTDSQGHVIEDIRADQNRFAAIYAKGRGIAVRNNQIVDTGGSTHQNSAYGIYVHGPANEVLNNRIVATTSTTGHAYGIYFTFADGSIVRGNRIADTSDSGGTSFGVDIFNSADVLAVDNSITVADFGIVYDTGSTGKYRDNLTSGVITGYFGGGSSAGGND